MGGGTEGGLAPHRPGHLVPPPKPAPPLPSPAIHTPAQLASPGTPGAPLGQAKPLTQSSSRDSSSSRSRCLLSQGSLSATACAGAHSVWASAATSVLWEDRASAWLTRSSPPPSLGNPPTPRPRAPTGQPVAGRTPDPGNLAGDPSPADPDPLPESCYARCQRPQGPRRGYRRFQERLCLLEDPLQGLLGSARAPSTPARRPLV